MLAVAEAQSETRTAPKAVPLRGPVAAILLLFLAISTLGYLHWFDRQHPLVHNDLIGRQFATRAALHGVSPYTPEMRRKIQSIAGHDPGQGFDYPILLAVLLAPLAGLPWPTLRLAFLVLLAPGLFGSFLLCFSLMGLRANRNQSILLALLCLCSWPVVFGLRLQQPTLLVAVFVLPAVWLLSRSRDIPAGILLALATCKPQLVLPLVLWLLGWSVFRRRWTFPLAFAVAELLFLLAGERLVPGWFHQWLGTLHQYRALGNVPPLDLYFGRAIGTLATAAILLGASLRLWKWRRCSSQSPEFTQAIALALAIAICVTPVIWAMIYNQVLLIPGCLLLAIKARTVSSGLASLPRHLSRALMVWTFASIPVAAIGEALTPSPVWMSLPFLGHLLAPSLALALMV